MNLSTKLAAALLSLRDDQHQFYIPYPRSKELTAAQIISRFQFDHHPIAKAEGGPDEPWNIVPRLHAEHRLKTATVDLPRIAKGKRIRKKQQRHVERMAAK